MKTELMYLVWVTTLTALIWIPYILDRIAVWGLMEAVGYPTNPKPQSPWAQRMMAAHVNAVENLVVSRPWCSRPRWPASAMSQPRLPVRFISGRAWYI